MQIKLFYDDLENIVSDYLIDNNYKLKKDPELVIDNDVTFIKTDVELEKKKGLNPNNSKLKADEIASAILESGFFMAGRGNFDLTFEQIEKIIDVAINTKDQEEKISALCSLYEKWSLG